MAFIEEHTGNPGKAEHDYGEAVRILRKYDILDSDPGIDAMTGYSTVLRKLHRGREAKSVNAELKTFPSAAKPAH